MIYMRHSAQAPPASESYSCPRQVPKPLSPQRLSTKPLGPMVDIKATYPVALYARASQWALSPVWQMVWERQDRSQPCSTSSHQKPAAVLTLALSLRKARTCWFSRSRWCRRNSRAACGRKRFCRSHVHHCITIKSAVHHRQHNNAKTSTVVVPSKMRMYWSSYIRTSATRISPQQSRQQTLHVRRVCRGEGGINPQEIAEKIHLSQECLHQETPPAMRRERLPSRLCAHQPI
jgi:hypothetical protein